MSEKARQLLWNRQRITLAAGATLVNTGIRQVSLAFGNSSVNEPQFSTVGTIGSRLQVVPLAPTANWDYITHGEPLPGPDGYVYVAFTNATSPPTAVPINVLFWDPHTLIGPGDADPYALVP